MPAEIERKYIVSKLPENLEKYPKEKILQGYLLICNDGVVRVRQKGTKFYQTLKSAGKLKRNEIELTLTKDQFEVLWPVTRGKNLIKYRYYIDNGKYTVELDVFKGDHEGLVIAEVEFPSEEESNIFEPPSWLGREVTDDERYQNSWLAVNGMPT